MQVAVRVQVHRRARAHRPLRGSVRLEEAAGAVEDHHAEPERVEARGQGIGTHLRALEPILDLERPLHVRHQRPDALGIVLVEGTAAAGGLETQARELFGPFVQPGAQEERRIIRPQEIAIDLAPLPVAQREQPRLELRLADRNLEAG